MRTISMMVEKMELVKITDEDMRPAVVTRCTCRQQSLQGPDDDLFTNVYLTVDMPNEFPSPLGLGQAVIVTIDPIPALCVTVTSPVSMAGGAGVDTFGAVR